MRAGNYGFGCCISEYGIGSRSLGDDGRSALGRDLKLRRGNNIFRVQLGNEEILASGGRRLNGIRDIKIFRVRESGNVCVASRIDGQSCSAVCTGAPEESGKYENR